LTARASDLSGRTVDATSWLLYYRNRSVAT
jgi:hypothetical protein